MRPIKFLSLLALITFAPLNAQDQNYSLTLDEAREYALEHNKTLLNAKDNITVSQEKIKETLSQGLPQVAGSMDFLTYFNYEFEFNIGGGGEGFDLTNPNLDAGDFVILQGLGEMFGSSEPIIMNNQLNGKIQLSQLIFSGQFLAGLQTVKIARALADQSLVKTEMDVKENVTNSYYVILALEKSHRIVSDNISNINTLLGHTQNLYKAGVAEATDVDQLRVTMSQIENTRKSLERNIQLNYNMLKFQLGVAPDTRITLSDNLDEIIGSVKEDVLKDYNVTDNIDYQMMESQVQLSQKQIDMQNWAYAPTLSGFYSYTKKIVTTGFDLTPNHLAGFNLSVPVFSSGQRRSKVAQAKINHEISLRNQEMVKEQLETQKNQLLFNYYNSVENFNTQKESVDVASRVLESTQNKFRQGLVSSLDLTQANTNYLTVENNYVTSVLTLLQAQTALNKLFNEL